MILIYSGTYELTDGRAGGQAGGWLDGWMDKETIRPPLLCLTYFVFNLVITKSQTKSLDFLFSQEREISSC